MMNSRFAISVHILTLLAKAEGDLLSSEYIAGSININPVLVRKELINLRNHHLVSSKEGKNGGSFLNKPAAAIKMSDIYKAVNITSLLGQPKNIPNPYCTVGKNISKHLDNLSKSAENALIAELAKVNLKKFIIPFE